MDAGATPMNAALHDDLLRSIQDTGVYGYGMDIGIIEPSLPAEPLDAHNSPVSFPQQFPQASPAVPAPSLQLSARGQQLVTAADSAIANALEANEKTRQSMARCEAANAAASDPEAALDATPKQRKKRPPARGVALSSAGSDGAQAAGGRNNGKGLRHFSMKVCEKVESKGRTTYNEVADELVGEFSGSPGIAAYDEKNIRRRVYDALNVLMAMDIIIKDKKDISWKGLPSAPHAQLEKLREERAALRQKILNQQVYLQETSKQHRAYRNLLVRHGDKPASMLAEDARAGTGPTPLKLPFILIQVNPEAAVEIQISDDNRQALFDFASTCFRIIGDEEVLYEMNLHLPPGGSSEAVAGIKSQAPDQSPALPPAFGGHQTPPGSSISALGSEGPRSMAATHGMRTMEQNGHAPGHGSAREQLSQVSEISQDLAMLSQSSQDQTQAMDEGTPPEKHRSSGPGPLKAVGTPPSAGTSAPGTAGNADTSPGNLLPPLTALSSSHHGLMSPTAEMMNASNAWRWPELQKEASMPSHVSSTTPTAPSAQMLQELMHQMQASSQGFAGRFPGAFSIPSLDAGQQPNTGQWHR